MVDRVDALVLSGGSAFGLDAASGVAEALRDARRGVQTPGPKIPIVPAAILYDLLSGGQKDWATNPYGPLGRQAFDAAGTEFTLGTAGAGSGATTAGLKGGIGSASWVLESGVTVGALVAVNAIGGVADPETGQFWAASFEEDGEFGGRGVAPVATPRMKHDPTVLQATTLAIVATDAALDKAQAGQVAMVAQDGMARAILPSHTMFDGDLVFAASTGARALTNPPDDLTQIGHAAATCLTRAIARGVYEATPAEGDPFPTWGDMFGTGGG
ncbi:MAG: peptidase T4 [Rhodobacteraceae bacterium]|nr:peptidase T4 [Paracoccaceae bacterium]